MIDVSCIIWDLGYSVVSFLVQVFHLASSMAIASTHSSSSSSLPSKHAVSIASKRSREVSMEVLVKGEEFASLIESPTCAGVLKVKRRPSRLIIPDLMPSNPSATVPMEAHNVEKDLEVEGDGYCVVSRKGNRMVMEDAYEAITNVRGDSKQAYFGVFDGHGGRAAVDYARENLGKNILRALRENLQAEELVAIRTGYLTTDQDFLSLKLGTGACAATVLVKDGKLHAANVGDCRVVLGRNGVAHALTTDHRAARDDERSRIERMEGSVSCHNGVWRVEKSLSISRAIGDLHMKEWIISEPEITSVPLTSDCEFAIVASDGLWDKVTNQEAVDMVKKGSNPLQSCKSLIEMSSIRGNKDDITVLLISLKKFLG